MSIYLYKFTTEKGKWSGWAGMAYAQNATQLYWLIDEQGDPNHCIIQKTRLPMSVGFKVKKEIDDKINYCESNKFEFSDNLRGQLNFENWVGRKPDEYEFAPFCYSTLTARLIKRKK